jgi:hypothetical protein
LDPETKRGVGQSEMAPNRRFGSGEFWRAFKPCVHWGSRSKRNETGVFGAVTGKASRLARPYRFGARKDPQSQWVSPLDPIWTLGWTPEASPAVRPARASPEYIQFLASQPETVTLCDVSLKILSQDDFP